MGVKELEKEVEELKERLDATEQIAGDLLSRQLPSIDKDRWVELVKQGADKFLEMSRPVRKALDNVVKAREDLNKVDDRTQPKRIKKIRKKK